MEKTREVKKLSRKDFLNDFYNQHLQRKVAAEIDSVFHQRLELSGQNPQKGLLRQAEMISGLKRLIDQAAEYLKIIEDLIEEEKK